MDIMTREEFLELFTPWQEAAADWHRVALKRERAMASGDGVARVDMRPITRGNVVRDFTVGQARRDEGPFCRVTKAGAADVVEIDGPHGPAVHIRFRRTVLEFINGDLVPVRPPQLSDTADRWFGNEVRLRSPGLVNMFDLVPVGPPTNVLLGRVDDLPLEDDDVHLVAACWRGSTLAWHVDLRASGSQADTSPLRPLGDAPLPMTPITITPRIARDQS